MYAMQNCYAGLTTLENQTEVHTIMLSLHYSRSIWIRILAFVRLSALLVLIV
jgi:hypothetical protein